MRLIITLNQDLDFKYRTYIPTNEKSITEYYDEITVKNIIDRKQTSTHVTKHVFQVAKGGNEAVEVQHIQFRSWEDHSVP